MPADFKNVPEDIAKIQADVAGAQSLSADVAQLAADQAAAPVVVPPVDPPVVVPPVTGGLPAAPSGPKPTNALRVILADNFLGTSLDPKIWKPVAHYPGAANISPGYNSYEPQAYDSANVSVANSICTLVAKTKTVTPAGGATKNYTCGIISTGNANNAFMVSPANGGPFYFEARIKIPGNTTGSGTSTFPAFWATTCRKWGDSSNSGLWTREMDFFEFHAPTNLDSVNIFPSGGYSTGGANMTNGGSMKTANVANMANDFHTYTTQVNADGSFTLWIDGAHIWDLPAHEARDWMNLIVNYGMVRPPGAGWPGDSMLIDYVIVWQDATVAAGKGVLGGGVAAGTTVNTP